MNNTLAFHETIALVNQAQAYEYQIKPGDWTDIKDKEHLKKLEGLGYTIRRKLSKQ